MTTTRILIAVHEIRGGLKKRDGSIERWTLAPGAAIPAGAKKSHGLGPDEIASLKASGAIAEVEVRGQAEDRDSAVEALTAQLAEAEAEVAALRAANAQLSADLEALTAPASEDAGADADGSGGA